jgi:hypothetical protein
MIRLCVDNALEIAGEASRDFHTSLSGVANARAKARPHLWKDQDVDRRRLLSRLATTSKG